MTDTTLEDFVTWVKIKPADEEYTYDDTGNCAYARFLRETGQAIDPIVGGWTWSDGDVRNKRNEYIPDVLSETFTYNCRTTSVLQGSSFGDIIEKLKFRGVIEE